MKNVFRIIISLFTLCHTFAFASHIPVRMNIVGDENLCNPQSFCIVVKPGYGITADQQLNLVTEFTMKAEREGQNMSLTQQFKTGWGVSDNLEPLELFSIDSNQNDIYEFNLGILNINNTIPMNCKVSYVGKNNISAGQQVTWVLTKSNGIFSCS